MDYEKMWKELKSHYENKVKELESKQYRTPDNQRTFAKTVVRIMEHVESRN